MKKIIVPIDFSTYSESALKVAAQLAKQNNSELILLHMLDISEQLVSNSASAKQQELMFFMQLAKKRFEEFVSKDYLNDVHTTPVIKHFRVFEEIINTAKELEADLIVMGSRGANGIKGFLLGSNTEKVVRTSEIPVLVIKSEIKSFNPKTIVFASDFKEENLKSYFKTAEFARLFNAELKLIYVNIPTLNFKSTLEIREQMRVFLSSAKIPYKSENINIYSDYEVESGIINAAHDLRADIIAIPTHGRKGFNKLLSGSIGEEVANTSDIPVLTIKIA